MADLAKVSLYSPWYSYRLFTSHVGLTPADFIRKLRLSKSALKLRDDVCKITDVAFEMGFASVDGYQRAFSREFGCNPGQYVDYCQAIEDVQAAIEKYDPSTIGLSWDKENPKIQLEPIGTRGYIELLAVK